MSETIFVGIGQNDTRSISFQYANSVFRLTRTDRPRFLRLYYPGRVGVPSADARDFGIIMTLNTLTFATLMALRRNRNAPPGLLPPRTCSRRC